MTGMSAGLLIPSSCEACHPPGEGDDHPKLITPGPVWHHDCVPQRLLADILGGAHSQHPLLTAKIFQAAREGVHGHELRAFIGKQRIRDFGNAQMAGTSGAPSAEANRYLTAKWGGTAYSVTSPFKLLFLSVVRTANNGSDTEWSTSAGYTAGTGASGLTMGAPANNTTGALATSTNAGTITNAPAGTWAGNKVVDSTGTPKELSYGALTGGSKTVNLGDTCSVPTGSYTDQMG